MTRPRSSRSPAGVEKFPAGFKDREGYHYGLRATVSVIAYNTRVLLAAEAPRTWKDLLDEFFGA